MNLDIHGARTPSRSREQLLCTSEDQFLVTFDVDLQDPHRPIAQDCVEPHAPDHALDVVGRLGYVADITSKAERYALVARARGRLQELYALPEPIEAHVRPGGCVILWIRLERNHPTLGSHALSHGDGVQTDVRPDIDKRVSASNLAHQRAPDLGLVLFLDTAPAGQDQHSVRAVHD